MRRNGARPRTRFSPAGAGTPRFESPRRRCRRQTFYMPWECGHYRHEYEKCQYVEWLKRSKDETVAAPAIEKGYPKALDHGHDGH